MSRREIFGFIGGGNMGSALIRGLLVSGRAEVDQIVCYDPSPEAAGRLVDEHGITITDGNQDLVQRADVVVLAIKPQNLPEVLKTIAPAVGPNHLVVSIAAGVTITTIAAALGADVPIVRVMPNTPALVLAGASAMCPGPGADQDHLARARALFDAVGLTVVVEEKNMDTVTGLSGGGPAYVAVFLEALADGAVRMGLPRKEALLLAAQTVLGSAKLAVESGRHPGQLKDMVTSPGGTTIAGMFALEQGAFRAAVMDAVARAAERSAELGKK